MQLVQIVPRNVHVIVDFEIEELRAIILWLSEATRNAKTDKENKAGEVIQKMYENFTELLKSFDEGEKDGIGPVSP